MMRYILRYYMIRYDIWYDTIYDVMWYDITRYDRMRYILWYDMIYDMIYDVMWYDASIMYISTTTWHLLRLIKQVAFVYISIITYTVKDTLNM
jgi:hypothetical protein